MQLYNRNVYQNKLIQINSLKWTVTKRLKMNRDYSVYGIFKEISSFCYCIFLVLSIQQNEDFKILGHQEMFPCLFEHSSIRVFHYSYFIELEGEKKLIQNGLKRSRNTQDIKLLNMLQYGLYFGILTLECSLLQVWYYLL